MATVDMPPPKVGRDGELMTLAEFRQLPDDGVERELLGGVVRVISEEEQMTRRSKRHCGSMSRVDQALLNWLDRDENATGCVMSGELGVDLPIVNLAVGSDVAYFRGDLLPEGFPDDSDNPYLELAPTLAVEILSPSDKHGDVLNRVAQYLMAGTEAVWLIDPVGKTVTSYADDRPPRMTSGEQPLTEPEVLPGFEIDVSQLFRFVIRKP